MTWRGWIKIVRALGIDASCTPYPMESQNSDPTLNTDTNLIVSVDNIHIIITPYNIA